MKKKRNTVKEAIDWMEWWKRKNLPPEVHDLHHWKMEYQERSQAYWDAEDWWESKRYDIRETFITLNLKYLAHKIKNETEEMLDVAERLYKSYTDTGFFIKEFDLDYSDKYEYLTKKATQLGSAKFLDSLKENWANIEKDYFKGCFDLTYDEFVSETLPEIEELLSKGQSTELRERVLDFDAYDSYYDEGVEAYFEGKSLSEVPITGNAWFREAWEEGWKNAKACDEEEYEADYEDEYWEDYDPIQESAKLKEGKDFVFVKIIDPIDDNEARVVVESYGGQMDSDTWAISKENVQDIKDELFDWKHRVAFYKTAKSSKA